MRTVVVASRYGGSGKSLIAVQLAMAAEANGRAILVDADPQQLMSWWWRLCPGRKPPLLECRIQELPGLIEAARREEVATTIVDTPPHVEVSIADALDLATLVVIPVRPFPIDLAAARRTFQITQRVGKPAVAVLNACPPGNGNAEAAVVRETRRILARMGLVVAETALAERATLAYALMEGRALGRDQRPSKAVDQVQRLWQELSGSLQECCP